MNDLTTRRSSEEIFALPPPPITDVETHPQNIQAGLIIVVSANLAVMIIVISGMMVGGAKPVEAIIAGVAYFTLTSPIYLAIVTGVLSTVIVRYAREKTERIRIDAYQELGERAIEWRLACEQTRQIELLGRRPPTEGVQRTSPLASYVAPFADGEQAQVEGVRFAMGLYSTVGHPDPKRVHADGRLKQRMLGSKRGSGSREAGRWLLRAGIIQRVRGGYALDVGRFPTRDSLRHLL